MRSDSLSVHQSKFFGGTTLAGTGRLWRPALLRQGVVVQGRAFGRQIFACFGIGFILVLGLRWLESPTADRWSLGASEDPRTARGPGWLLTGPELANAVPAPQLANAEQGVEAFRYNEIETAIAAFRSLALDLPENPAIQSNLASVYLARAARKGGNPHDLILALDAAERAAHLAPRLAPALFNRAEALTRLRLPAAATAAWNRFLALASDSPRADRAQQAMAALHETSAFDAWQTNQRRFETAALDGDEGELRDLVRRYPLFARLYTEEALLPAWGRAALTGGGDAAGRLLAALGRIGRAFAERTHDAMVADTVGTIERADAPLRVVIARGAAAFGEGMARYRQVVLKDPEEPLQRAAAELEAAACPLALWARLYGSVPLLYRDSDEAEGALRKLNEAVDAARYPVLSGRVEWLRGIAAIQRDRPERAIGHYRVALNRLAPSEGPQSADFLHLLFAEAFGRVGDRDQEWVERCEALRAVQRTGELRGIFSTLYDSIESLLAEGRPWACLGFAEELQRVSRWNIPSSVAETGLQRGRVFDAVGDPIRAVEEFRRAEDSLGAIGFAAFRERIGMTLAMAEGKALAASEPAAAIPWLTTALERQHRHAYYYQQASLLSVRAMAFRALGRLPKEEADLERAIETFETQRLDIVDPGLRQSAFEAAQSAFDRMVSIQAEELGNVEQALSYAERSRGRLLLDQVSGAKARGAFSLADLEEALPAGTVLVEYAVLPDRLYIWTLAGRQLEFHVEPIAAADLARLVEQLEIGIGSKQIRRRTPGPAAALYDHLFRPIARHLPAEARLAIVPDRFLARVPFAALFNASSGRFLIEDRIITVQASASLFCEVERRPRNRSAAAGLLAVGDPAFDQTVYGSLARLPHAAAEAREIASLYGNAVLLTGSAATRGAFVRAAPDAAVIHVAGHALADPRAPQHSSLVLRPDSPGEAGAISAALVAGLDLRGTELVVLSVCRGVAGGARGRESVSGLATGFLAAGARTVVANLWDASDKSTRELMIEFHRRFRAGESPAQALRSVQLAALRREDLPVAWAGFAVFGTDGPGLAQVKPNPHRPKRRLMIPLILVISGMVVYEMNPPANFKGPGQGLIRIPLVTPHTPFFVFDPSDFGPYLAFDSLAKETVADLITLPDGTQRARIDLTNKLLEIGSGTGMTAKWNGTPTVPIYDESTPEALEALDWVPSFFELTLGVAQPLKADTDFISIVTIGLGILTSAGQPMNAGKIVPLDFLKVSGTTCSIAPHGVARYLSLKADGTDLILLLKDKTSMKTLAAGKVVAVPRGPVTMSVTNFLSVLTPPSSTTRLDHLEMIFQEAIKNPPASDKICLPSPPPPGTVTGSSAFCPPLRP